MAIGGGGEERCRGCRGGEERDGSDRLPRHWYGGDRDACRRQTEQEGERRERGGGGGFWAAGVVCRLRSFLSQGMHADAVDYERELILGGVVSIYSSYEWM